jgi:hypothetical protein
LFVTVAETTWGVVAEILSLLADFDVEIVAGVSGLRIAAVELESRTGG